jgi:hypothetical protein
MSGADRVIAAFQLDHQYKNKELSDLADAQEAHTQEKKRIRDRLTQFDSYTADGVLEIEEFDDINRMRREIGSEGDESKFHEEWYAAHWTDDNGGNWDGVNRQDARVEFGNTGDENQRKNKDLVDSLRKEIENTLKGVEDKDDLVQFRVQMAMSGQQNSDTMMTQLTKKQSEGADKAAGNV